MTNKRKKQQGGLRCKEKLKYSTADNPLVSIITVVFNSDKYIEKTINSVLEQTYDNCEYIIVDGCSTDRTIEIIKKYESKIDYWSSEPDNGIYDAMNKGIKIARGDIIGILNSGDFYDKNAVEKIVNIYNVNKIENYSSLVIIGAICRFSENENVKFKQIADVFDSCGPVLINHPATFVARSVYENIGYFNLQYRIVADYDFILRAYHNEETRFIFINDNLTYMIMGGTSEKLSTLVTRLRERFDIRSKYIPLIDNLKHSYFWISKKIIYHSLSSIIGNRVFFIKLFLTDLAKKIGK